MHPTESLGWAPIKQLHDSLAAGHGEIKSDLQRYFLDSPGGSKNKFGPSLDQEWESHEQSLYHHAKKLGGGG